MSSYLIGDVEARRLVSPFTLVSCIGVIAVVSFIKLDFKGEERDQISRAFAFIFYSVFPPKRSFGITNDHTVFFRSIPYKSRPTFAYRIVSAVKYCPNSICQVAFSLTTSLVSPFISINAHTLKSWTIYSAFRKRKSIAIWLALQSFIVPVEARIAVAPIRIPAVSCKSNTIAIYQASTRWRGPLEVLNTSTLKGWTILFLSRRISYWWTICLASKSFLVPVEARIAITTVRTRAITCKRNAITVDIAFLIIRVPIKVFYAFTTAGTCCNSSRQITFFAHDPTSWGFRIPFIPVNAPTLKGWTIILPCWIRNAGAPDLALESLIVPVEARIAVAPVEASAIICKSYVVAVYLTSVIIEGPLEVFNAFTNACFVGPITPVGLVVPVSLIISPIAPARLITPLSIIRLASCRVAVKATVQIASQLFFVPLKVPLTLTWIRWVVWLTVISMLKEATEYLTALWIYVPSLNVILALTLEGIDRNSSCPIYSFAYDPTFRNFMIPLISSGADAWKFLIWIFFQGMRALKFTRWCIWTPSKRFFAQTGKIILSW